MVNETSQYDIPDRLLRASSASPRADKRKDIGEAKIIYTISGRAKVRVIRERDRKVRAWLLAVLAVTALAAGSLEGWIAWQQSKQIPNIPLSEKIKVSPPVFQPADVAPSTTKSSGRNNQKTPTEIVFDSMTTRRPPPPQPIAPKAVEPTAAQLAPTKPVVPTGSTSATPQPAAEKPATVAAPVVPLNKENTSIAADNQTPAPAKVQP